MDKKAFSAFFVNAVQPFECT